MKNSNADKASRATLPGTGDATVVGPLKDGKTETVHTFGWYLRQMIKDARAKNTVPLISGMVPTNSFQGSTFRTDWPMANSAATVAKEENVEYIDHTKYSSERFQALGPGPVKAFFPTDNTHTNAAGAKGMASLREQTNNAC
jgi:rhamnogalacturonan acetylesterase